MSSKGDVWQGTLALMVLKTLERKGALHGYGVARQIEQTSADLLSLNYGTLYPALLKLEQEGYITSEWGFRTTTGRRNFTNSREAAANRSRRKPRNGNRQRPKSLTQSGTQALAFWMLSRFIFETSVVGLIRNKAAAPSMP